MILSVNPALEHTDTVDHALQVNGRDPANDNRFDVIVVGGGNAALCAALSAHEAGARVVILESAPEAERGGNSRFAGAIFRIPHVGLDDVRTYLCDDAVHEADRVRIDAYTDDDYTKDLMVASAGRADRETIEVLLREAPDTMKWMKDLGVHWELTLGKYFDHKSLGPAVVDLPPGACVKARREGVGLMDDLWAAVERADIDVRYDAPAHDLIVEGNSVRGVLIRTDTGFVEYRGQVILACGGFEANPAMRRQYLGEGWDLVNVRGCRFNNGRMLERALAHGAQPFGHWGGCHSSPQDASAPLAGSLATTPKVPRYSYPYAIMVNLDGRRFCDEGEDNFGMTYAKLGAVIRGLDQGKAFQIFDQKTLHLLEPRYKYTPPVTDVTLEGLARKLGLRSPEVFVDTVERFNAACPREGEFYPFKNDGLATAPGLTPPKSNWAQPIDKPPYAAYTVVCGITFTYGGLKCDPRTARVLNAEDGVMPGLFATGEIVGGLFYHNYPGGAGLTKGSVFGRIAGREAAAEAIKAAQH